METHNRSTSIRAQSAAVTVLVFALMVGCSSAPKKNAANPTYGPELPTVIATDIKQPQENFGPAEPPSKEAIFGPSILEKKKVSVVFTPGLARGFAAVGVLTALEQAGIEIESIYGVEIPGMISGLFAFSQNQNEFEWRVQKLKATDFVSKNLFTNFFNRGRISSESLEEKLRQSLKSKKDFSSARSFLNLCDNKEGGAFEQLKRVVKTESLFLNPEGCDMQVWKGRSADGQSARIVLVDLFGDAKAGLSKRDSNLEKKYEKLRTKWADTYSSADVLIRPKLNEYDLLDFDRKTDIAFVGKEATESVIEQIKELLK